MRALSRNGENRGSAAREGALGYTLIEALVTIALTVLIMGAVTSSILALYRGNRYAMEQAVAVESARRGIEQMVRDIREASYSDRGSYPVIEIGSTTMAIYTDLDRDDAAELVRFRLDGLSFVKEITNVSGNPPTYDEAGAQRTEISSHVRNIELGMPVFRYFDSAGTEITSYTDITKVAFVQVSLVVNVNPLTLPNEFVLRSSATLRNLKVNL